jgi:trehalose-phosphatase
MKPLKGGVDPERFFASLSSAPSRVLLLDYDGTLAPFHEDRDRATPYPAAIELVRRIQKQGRSRVVVVSGRTVASLLPLLGLHPAPELWGNHGWERLRAGKSLERTHPGAAARLLLDEATRRASHLAPEGRVEVKPASIAVHTRGLSPPDSERLLVAVRSDWRPMLENGPLEVHEFDGGVELRVRGRDKGTAVREVLSEEPQGSAVAYLGDDLTDEDGFRALAERGLSVLVRSEPRETAADLWIRPPDEMTQFLTRWLEESGRAAGPPGPR